MFFSFGLLCFSVGGGVWFIPGGFACLFFQRKKYLKYIPDFFSFHLNDTLGIFRRGLIWYSETNDWLVNEQ